MHSRNRSKVPIRKALLGPALTITLLGCATAAPPSSGAGPASVELIARKTPPLKRLAAEVGRAPNVVSAELLREMASPAPGQLEPRAVLERYTRAGTTSRFANVHGLTKAGQLALATVRAARSYGLDARRYALPRLATLVAAQASHRAAVRAALATPPERQRGSRRARSAYRALQRSTLRLELTLATALLGFAQDLSRGNTRAVALALKTRAKLAPGVAPVFSGIAQREIELLSRSGPRALVLDRLRRDLARLDGERALRSWLVELLPHPQYRGLMIALARYRRIVAAGGWARARPRRLRPGQHGKHVSALARRLAREGYYPGTGALTRRFDAQLVAAVRAFRRGHQLGADGLCDRAFWRALNISARRRLAAIELTLARWRETPIARGAYHLLVNIPDFHVEVWRGGRRVHRRRVVVGKPYRHKCDARRYRRVLAYATPQHASYVQHIAFSPYWNVTREIKETELDVKQIESPLYYAKRGYELLRGSGGAERVRQLPGPQNSLGFAVLQFPNRHHVYLHGSPQRSLFGRNRRAFSHGCVRVQGIEQLAKLLLIRDGQWDEQRYRRLRRRWWAMNLSSLRANFSAARFARFRRLARGLPRRVTLRKPVAIHLAYYTVRADRHGGVLFLNDIYRRDAARRAGRRPRRCLPQRVIARRRFGRTPQRLTTLAARAANLALELPRALRDGGDLVARLPAGKRSRWLRYRLARLRSFTARHQRLATQVRAEYDALAKLRGERAKGKWRGTESARALKLRRLLLSLSAMVRNAERLCRRMTQRSKQRAPSVVGRAHAKQPSSADRS
jgi:murein L,D-transpeptidase YcbB/YkuD